MVNRRLLVKLIAALPFARALFGKPLAASAPVVSRVRPGEPGWPSDDAWREFGAALEGRLVKVESPLAACVGAPAEACAAGLQGAQEIPITSATRSG